MYTAQFLVSGKNIKVWGFWPVWHTRQIYRDKYFCGQPRGLFLTHLSGIFINISAPNLTPVSGGDKIKVGKVGVEFIHTPGHTPGSQCFLVNNRLVSGDTLFIGYCGRCDLPGGNPDQMYESLTQKLAKLGDDTLLYPGHNYSDAPVNRLGDEKKTNPYLAARSAKDFYRVMEGLLD